MKTVALAVLSTIGYAAARGAETIYGVKFGDKFGDGWNGAKLSVLIKDYNASYTVTDRDFQGISDDMRAYPMIGDGGFDGGIECDSHEAMYFAMVYGENNTLLTNQEPPVQSWEIYYQVIQNKTVYHGGWNTQMGFTCDANHTLLDWSENLLEPLGSCPECQHPKPKPKPKAKPKSRRLDDKDDDSKGAKNKPVKYWPVPVKLMDVSDSDGWFMPDTRAYAEFTISDASRMNLLGEGTLCAAKGSDGYKTVCETMLPDGHYIFRASGNLDVNSANYTWQLCGKEAIKFETGMSDPAITGKNATMQYDYKTATGRMGNEVSFQIKKGKCMVDEIVTVADYVNGTALDTVLTLEGHLLLENVHFEDLSAVESSFLEADISEFVSLEVDKSVSVTAVENVNDGTLVSYRVVATHAESLLMHGTMDHVIETATEQLQTQMSGGGFLNFMKNGLMNAGLSDDKLMAVNSISFVDLTLDHMVTLHDGETASGDFVAGADNFAAYTPVISGDKAATHDPSSSSSDLVLDILTASGAFAMVAVVVVLVVTALKPPAAATSSELDNSSANLVVQEVESAVSMDVSSSDLLAPSAPQDAAFSYQDSLSAALTQRWEMNSEDDSVRL
jgi:hypothetical protein